VEFFVHCRDRPDTAELRDRLGEAHWSFMDGYADGMVARGPTLDPARERATGSVHIVDLPDAAAARVFAYEEPNYRAGVYRDATIRRWRNELGRTMWDFAGTGGERFLVVADGRPGAGFLARNRDRLIAYGPLLSDDGAAEVGTVMIVEQPGRADVEALVGAEPLTGVEIHEWQPGGRPARNRVTPTGDIVSIELRGAWTGNRGILHDGRRIVRFHASDLWITCALSFRDRWSPQWRPHHFTWLYFHDEAVSFAAGHRPCGECRRASYRDYRDRWADSFGIPAPSAREMNRRLHGERIVRGTHRRRVHELPWPGLPDGTFVHLDAAPAVVLGAHLTQWTPEGYGTRVRRPAAGTAQVITPPATVAVLRAGYPVQVDDSALPL
jgi:uncharacterized protein YciI